jgi:hypothetical protein
VKSLEVDPALSIEAQLVRDALNRHGEWSVRLLWPRLIGLSRPGAIDALVQADGEAWQALLALARAEQEPPTPS